jgi:SAM-dependent methyltransferase
MGSSSVQSPLWGAYPREWASVQEPTGLPGYTYAFDHLGSQEGETLLDIGCGSGFFASLADGKGLTVTGLDATAPLLEVGKKRAPSVQFLTGDMEDLPFADQAFDIVTGFNSFQYAADVATALAEARRVLKNGGKLAAMVWGEKEDCEATTYLKAVGSLLPPPPPGAGGPFALTENHRLEAMLEAAGFTLISSADIPSIWDYPDLETAVNGLLSAGPAVKAINHNGYERVRETVTEAARPYVQPNGRVIYRNTFRVVLARK